MSDITTPAGRLVQGKLEMQQRKDTKTKQPLWKDPLTKLVPDMGLFFSLAFPKVLPDGKPNAEFEKFWSELAAVAAQSWPQFFPSGAAKGGYAVRPDLALQGHTMATLAAHGTPEQLLAAGYLTTAPVGPASSGCTNPKFSWKYQDGDGVDTNGQSVAAKPGFKGHHIIKFDTNFPVSCFHLNQYRPDQEIGVGPNARKVTDIIRRGFWVIANLEVKSNNADLTQQQVPGISLYPKLITFLGGNPAEEIKSGPDAQQVFGGMVAGWRPEGISAIPGAPVGTLAAPGTPGGTLAAPGLPAPGGGLALPTAAGLPAPPALTVPVQPTYVVRPDLALQGHTMATLAAHGTPEQLLAAGYVTVSTPPALTLPAPGGLPAPGALAAPGLALGAPGLPAPAAAAPVYAINPALAAQGVTLASIKAQGWDDASALAAGHIVRVA